MNNSVSFWMSLIVLLSVSGCSTIKSFFPDKEKDYRFTRELPDLVIPNGLDNKAALARPVISMSKAAPSITPSPVEAPIEAAAPAAAPVAPDNGGVATAPLIEAPLKGSNYADNVPEAETPVAAEVAVHNEKNDLKQIHINQNLDRSARIVGKALTEQSVEIVERNSAEHYFLILYDPAVTAMKDESIWDDLEFMFGEEHNQEQAYRIALQEKDHQTDISVLEKDGKACTSNTCAQLLLFLKTAIEKSIQE